MIKNAQTKLGGMKEFQKRLEHAIKITNIMMLKTKIRKAQHWGTPWTILQINSKVQKFMKKKRVWDISTSDP
jgi:hypothetical protein